jgi:hypothetical protein
LIEKEQPSRNFVITEYIISGLYLRGCTPFPSHWQAFEITYSEDSLTKVRNPNKVQLRETIRQLRAEGMSYREIAQVIGLPWTRIQQIVKSVLLSDSPGHGLGRNLGQR